MRYRKLHLVQYVQHNIIYTYYSKSYAALIAMCVVYPNHRHWGFNIYDPMIYMEVKLRQ